MAAGGFRTFVSGETLDEDKINDFLMQGVLVFEDAAARDAAITAPVHGQVAFLKDTNETLFYDGTGWEILAAGLSFATVSNTPTGTYTDAGIDYAYWEFTSNGNLTVTEPGLLDILVVGGGGGGAFSTQTTGAAGGGGSGGVRFGIFDVSAGSFSITVGAGGAASSVGGGSRVGGSGTGSAFGSILIGGGGGSGRYHNGGNITFDGVGGGAGQGGFKEFSGTIAWGGGQGVSGSRQPDGIVLNYSGVSVEYGRGGQDLSTAQIANTGSGGHGTNASVAARTGTDGVVIARVRL